MFSEFLLQAGRITNLSAEQVSAATDLGGGDFVDIEPDAITTPTDERIESLNQEMHQQYGVVFSIKTQPKQ